MLKYYNTVKAVKSHMYKLDYLSLDSGSNFIFILLICVGGTAVKMDGA